jgi:hypothetical protein
MTGTLVASRVYGAPGSLLDAPEAAVEAAQPRMGSFAVSLGQYPEPDKSLEDPRPAESRGPRTLEQLIVDTWEGLVRGTSQCPVCGGRLEPQYGAHARPVAGRCRDCGSALS